MMHFELWWLWAALGMDALSTVYALHLAGTQEANPTVRWLFNRIGVIPGLLVSRAVVVAIVLWAEPSDLVLWVMLAVFVAAIVQNIRIVLRG